MSNRTSSLIRAAVKRISQSNGGLQLGTGRIKVDSAIELESFD